MKTQHFVFHGFFFLEERHKWDHALFSGSRALFTGPINIFFNKIFIKNGSHSTIHTFKKYFATVFSIFSKINGIQTHPNI